MAEWLRSKLPYLALGYPTRMRSPMLSVLTATRNAASKLPALIDCMRAQSARHHEWIVVDGASTDGTHEILANAGDVVTRWISEPDFGIYDALNKALMIARGSHYLVVGSDDTLEAHALATFEQVVQSTDADIVAACVRTGGELVQPRTVRPWLFSGPPMVAAHSVGTLIRKALHDELGYYSSRFPIAADTHFLLKAQEAGKRFVETDKVVGSFGLGGVSSVDTMGALCDSWRANVEVRGHYWLQLPVLFARLLVNGSRIVSGLRQRGPR